MTGRGGRQGRASDCVASGRPASRELRELPTVHNDAPSPCARKRGRACLFQPIFCSFPPTSASAAQGLSFGRPKHNFGVIKQITRGAARYSSSRKSCARGWGWRRPATNRILLAGRPPRGSCTFGRGQAAPLTRRTTCPPLASGARPLAEGLFRRCDARATPLGRIPNCAICAFPPSALPSVNRESLLVPN
jgi:hypothetical protein